MIERLSWTGMQKRPRLLTGWHSGLAAAALLLACESGGGGAGAPEPGGDNEAEANEPLQEPAQADGRMPDDLAVAEVIDPEVRARIESGETVDVLIFFDATAVDDELTRVTGTRDRRQDPDAVRQYGATLVQGLVTDTLKTLPPDGAATNLRFDSLPVAGITLSTGEALALLEANPLTMRVDLPRDYSLVGAQSLPLIGQPTAAAGGLTGAGTTVAVLDTGADYTHADFGSCTAPGVPANCRVNVALDFAPQDNLRDDTSKHGTNVSAIVAKVAPGTKIAALDVFRPNGLASSSDILMAIDWVIANRATYNIVAMNLSLGGGRYYEQCPNDIMAAAIASARSQGILAAVATGNDGYTNSVASPACGPAGVSVGAVYDSNIGPMGWAGCSDSITAADRVTCFSNSASFITMLAPGAMITAGGVTMGGTSMAAPHVAGALAVLAAAYPNDTPDQRVARMTTTGPSISDHRNSVVKRRLSLSDIAAGCASQVNKTSIAALEGASTGTVNVTIGNTCQWSASKNADWITINTGASGTGNGTVSYTIAANSGGARSGKLTVAGHEIAVTQAGSSAAPQVSVNGGQTAVRTGAVILGISGNLDPFNAMCISNTEECTKYVALNSSAKWSLTKGNGNKTVYVFFRKANNDTVPVTANVVLDATAPTGGALAATHGISQNVLTWSAFADPHSGIAGYKLVFAPGNKAPGTCAAGTVLYEGTGSTYTHTGLTNGTTYAYRVCATDVAGNIAKGAIATATPAPETTPPVGTASIQGGGSVVSKGNVVLQLSATDASGMGTMCISEATTCTKWVAYATTAAVKLSKGGGEKTIRVWFRDIHANTSAPVLVEVVVDSVPPTDGTVVATPANGAIGLSWTGFADAHSGIASYVVVQASGTKPPAKCTGVTPLYSGTSTSFNHTGVTNGSKVSYRVCAVDGAGLMSKGAVVTGFAAPETQPPVGGVDILVEGEWVNSTKVTLALEASDNTGVARVCISNTQTCTAWRAFTPQVVWYLDKINGEKTVYVYFEDDWGNQSTTPATASILLDTVPPVDGTAQGPANNGQVALSWTAASDSASGLAGYRVVYSASAKPPTSCNSGTVVYTGSGTSYSHTGLAAGSHSYRICSLDNAGNVSKGVAVTASF